MVLADDNFASIAHAVEEGRTIYDNLKKSILFILPTNGGEALIILAAILLGFSQLPLTPVQILWVNMVTAVTLALSLAFEPPEPGVMCRPPRDPAEPLLSPYLVWRVLFVSALLMAGTFLLVFVDMQRGASIEHSRTVAVNALVVFEVFYLFNSRYVSVSALSRTGLTGNPYVLLAVGVLLVLQLAYTYWEPMQLLFGTASVELLWWPWIVLVGLSLFLVVEFEKFLVRRRQARQPAPDVR